MLLAWTLAVFVGAVSIPLYITWLVGNLMMGAFMAAVGVRCSLSLPTATKSMSWTIAIWLGMWPVLAFVAISIIGLVVLTCTAAFGLLTSYGFLSAGTKPWFPMSFSMGWTIMTNLTTLLFTILIASDTSPAVRPDRRPDGGRSARDHRRRHGSRHRPPGRLSSRQETGQEGESASEAPRAEQLPAPVTSPG